MKHFFIASLLILIGANSYSQYQTRKGHWMITHTIVNGGPFWYNNKYYEDGVLENISKGKEINIGAAFTSPWWGGAEFSHEKNLNEKPAYVKSTDLGFSIEPQAGYFIKDNLMVGAAFIAGFDNYTVKEGTAFNKFRTWYVGAGPIARYYFGTNKKYRAFAGFESRAFIEKGKRREEYTNSNNKLEEYSRDTDAFGFRVKPYAGYALFFGKHWTADVHVGFLYDKSDYKSVFKSYTDKVIKAGYPYTEREVYNNKMLSLNVGITYTF